MALNVDLEQLGRVLKAHREARRLRQSDVARLSGLSQGYIGNVEAARPRIGGRPSRPSRSVIQTWTRALGLERVEADEVLALAGYSAGEQGAKELAGSGDWSGLVQDWDRITQEIQSAVTFLLHRARGREDAYELANYLRATVELLQERLDT